MAGAEDFEALLAFHEGSDLLEGFCGVQIFRAVFEIAGPVFEFFGRGPGEQRREEAAGQQGGEKFEEGAFVHGGGV